MKNTSSFCRIGRCGGGNCSTSSAVRMPSTPGIFSASDGSMLRIFACGIGLVSSLQNTMPSARKSSAYFARPVTFATTSCGTKFWPTSLFAMSRLLSSAHDAAQVVIIGAAPTEIPGHREARLFYCWMRILTQQCDGGHDLTAGTKPTLWTQFRHKCCLHLVQLAVRSFDAFDRGDLPIANAVGQRRAGIHRRAIEDDGA